MIYELDKQDYYKIKDLGLLVSDNFDIGNISDFEKVLVYSQNSTIVAFLQYRKIIDTIDIINIAVLDNFRNNGIGSKLISELSKFNDVISIMLEVRKSNNVAIEFYKHNGFMIIREIKDYYNDESAYSMKKEL